MRFQDKVVLVTGSSRNTGWGIARAFLAEGAFVCVNGSTVESTAKGAAALRAEGFDRILELPGDIGDPNAVAEMFQKIRDHYGRIDILVNNGVLQGCGYSFEEVPFELFDEVIRTNLMGTILMSQAAVKMMIEQKTGVIVNFSSNVSVRAIRNRTAYCASKGGIDGLTRAMALDLAKYGIRVNSVAPGYIYTDRWDVLPAEHAARRRTNIPLGREAHADDIAAVVMFLASDESRLMTGERLVVDGGCTAQHMPADVDV